MHDLSSLTLHGGDYEHTLELAGVHDALNLSYVTGPVVDIFRKMIETRAFQACEMSLANYMVLRDRGDDWLEAVPIFPFRSFRHSAVYVRTDSKISEPKALAGLRVGVPDYGMTAAVWVRGILAEQYGVPWRSIEWHSSGQRIDLPAAIEVHALNGEAEQALVDGRVDAAILASSLKSPPGVLRHLLPDARQAELEYFRNTSIYPIMHTVVVRKDVFERIEDLPARLLNIYASSKRGAYIRRLSRALHPWGDQHWETLRGLFGGDPLPYGLTDANRLNISKLAEYLIDQGLIKGAPVVSALFVPGSDALLED